MIGGSGLTLLGLLLAVGFVVGHMAERIGVPRIAAYVLVGAAFSQPFLGQFIIDGQPEWDPVLVQAALGAVAFMIGGELEWGWLRRLGGGIAGGTLGQSVGALAVVTVTLWAYGSMAGAQSPLATGLVLGAIATATAPAATLAVIEEYQTRGPLTMTLLGVVALDDMLSIILFTLALVAAGGAGEHQLLSAFWEIGGAIALGSAMGCLLGWFGWRVEQEDLRLPVVAGSILLAVGLANLLHLSPLLTCMLLGLVSKEFFDPQKTQQWLRPMTHIQELIFLTLFTLAGTHFEPAVFVDSLGFIAAYAVARVVGKVVGAWLGTTIVKAPAVLRHRLGFALLPQAGVSIGLALVASGAPGLEQAGPLIVNTILGTTILFELVAPILTKIVLVGAGEAKQ